MAVVTAIAVTALLALGSFILSFSALWDIATEIWPQRELSWIAPVIVDGTILQATISLVAAAGDESRRSRQFFWFLLTTAAAISIAGNALHAYISDTARLDPMVAVIGGTTRRRSCSCRPTVLFCSSGFGPNMLRRASRRPATTSRPKGRRSPRPTTATRRTLEPLVTSSSQPADSVKSPMRPPNRPPLRTSCGSTTLSPTRLGERSPKGERSPRHRQPHPGCLGRTPRGHRRG
ncbi:DUF2637 domain-containing protein [Williamsia sp. D3]|uniref:DUF2637 domain-containing protein n=1 Tax=Williamsia sp. D3 TaxID=1313067 RepID=UPI0009DE034A